MAEPHSRVRRLFDVGCLHDRAGHRSAPSVRLCIAIDAERRRRRYTALRRNPKSWANRAPRATSGIHRACEWLYLVWPGRSGARRKPSQPAVSDLAEPVDRGKERFPLLRVSDAKTGPRGEREDADLALVQVAVDVVRRLPDVDQGIRLAQRGVDEPTVHQVVGLPRLAVVGEVRAEDPLEAHPQVTVVVLVHEP